MIRFDSVPLCTTLLWAGWLALGACADEERAPPRVVDQERLVDASGWRALEPWEDPWFDERVGLESCSTHLPIVEDAFLEFDTKRCSSFSVERGTLHDVRPGDRIDILLWHAVLLADAPSVGVVILEMAGEERWRLEVPIPSPPAYIAESFAVDFSMEVGDPIRLHVRNHGANTYTLGSLRVSH